MLKLLTKISIEFGKFWVGDMRNPYSAEYLLNQSKLVQEKWKNKKVQEIIKGLYAGILESSKNGNTYFYTKSWMNDDLSDYYSECTDEEWESLKNKFQEDFQNVRITYENNKPYNITFDWSGEE